jgi:hypothetical protein
MRGSKRGAESATGIVRWTANASSTAIHQRKNGPIKGPFQARRTGLEPATTGSTEYLTKTILAVLMLSGVDVGSISEAFPVADTGSAVRVQSVERSTSDCCTERGSVGSSWQVVDAGI